MPNETKRRRQKTEARMTVVNRQFCNIGTCEGKKFACERKEEREGEKEREIGGEKKKKRVISQLGGKCPGTHLIVCEVSAAKGPLEM